MTVIYTGMEDLDRDVAAAINGKQAFYADYLLEEKEADTVILSTNIETKIPFKDFLFALRRDNKRVILLIGDEKSPYLGYALALGIYDLITDPIDANKIIEAYRNPADFSKVAPLYLGLRERVSFGNPVSHKMPVKIEGIGDINLLQDQMHGMLALIGKDNKEMNNVNEMALILEQYLIQNNI